MASISDDGNGLKRILFINAAGKRKAMRLGKVTMKQAERFKVRIEDLVSASIIGQAPADETVEWLDDLDETMHGKIAATGLVKDRGSARAITLAAFIDGHIADRTDAKPRTIINLKQARADLVKFFGAAKPLREITEGDADELWRWMVRDEKAGGRGLGPNTARRVIGRSKQFFRVAIRKRLVSADPFAGVKSKVQGNTDREFFVTRDMAQKVIDQCPDAEWRLIFALSRYGGLRCPSEHLGLKWTDVDWENNRLTVHSPKTEHHEGHDQRIIPLFPELRAPLLECFELADEGAQHVITRYRDSNQNLRTQLNRIIGRAGLEPWPKLFHNLRATRETELTATYPLHVVCAWIGNSEKIAQKHYLQITDTHFANASTGPSDAPDEKAAHNPAHTTAEQTGNASGLQTKKPRFFRGFPSQVQIRLQIDYPQGESNPCPLAENQIS